MPRNQTITYLSRRLAEIGVEPDSRKGQNFLIDQNLLRVLADAAELSSRDVALEIGTGTGALTELLAERAGAVVTVEIDEPLYNLASELLLDQPHVTMLHFDALKNKNAFDLRVRAAVDAALAAGPDRRLKLTANLPYSIATPVVTNLLAWDSPPVSMTITIQKELADRFVAVPRTKDYSALSLWVQCQCRIETLRTLAPSVFWPRPKVQSAIVQLTLEPERRAIPHLEYFHQFVRAMFFHRRKFLRANLLGAFKKHLDKPAIDALMNDLAIAPNARAEELDVATMLRLSEAAWQKAPEWRL